MDASPFKLQVKVFSCPVGVQEAPADVDEGPSDLAFLPRSAEWPRPTERLVERVEPEEIVVPGARKSKLAGGAPNLPGLIDF